MKAVSSDTITGADAKRTISRASSMERSVNAKCIFSSSFSALAEGNSGEKRRSGIYIWARNELGGRSHWLKLMVLCGSTISSHCQGYGRITATKTMELWTVWEHGKKQAADIRRLKEHPYFRRLRLTCNCCHTFRKSSLSILGSWQHLHTINRMEGRSVNCCSCLNFFFLVTSRWRYKGFPGVTTNISWWSYSLSRYP